MASMVASKLARAAVACLASPAAIGGCRRPVSSCLPRIGRRMFRSIREELWFSIVQPVPGRPTPEEARRALTVTEETLKSNEALRAMYDYWRKYYGISREGAELEQRFKIFKKNARKVHKINNSGRGYYVGLNLFADQTTEEIPTGLLSTEGLSLAAPASYPGSTNPLLALPLL